MSEPFLAEIRMVGFNFAPRGWAFCDGQILPINQNQSLYSLLGTNYGGDGRTSFALPDMRGRVPVHHSADEALGAKDGEEQHLLTAAEMPMHSHTLGGSTAAVTSNDPTGRLFGDNAGLPYHALGAAAPMAEGMIASVGGGQPHDNMQPYLAVHFCIAMRGLFPSRN